MAGALLVASVVNFVLLIGERHRAQLIEQTGPAVARFVDVAREVFNSPPELGRPTPIARLGPSRYQVQIANPIDTRKLARDSTMEQRLSNALKDADLDALQIRASVTSIMLPDRGGPGSTQRQRFDNDDRLRFGPDPNPTGPQLRLGDDRRFPNGSRDQTPAANAEPPRPPREAREIVLTAQLPDKRWLTSITIAPQGTSGDIFLLGASTFIVFAFVLAAALWIANRVGRPLR
ncbi:MAG: hypothetical protein EON93_13030, partial [Burkholderiales bacterium]